MQVERNAPTDGAAHRQGGAAPLARVTADPRLALSGLKKLERLEDRPHLMLKNQLQQDARHDDTERPPW